MTQLPEKDLLNGSKTPKTSTIEMKTALGELRDYLSELLGPDSADKAGAREALGVNEQISELQNALDKASLTSKKIVDALGFTPYDATNPDHFIRTPDIVRIEESLSAENQPQSVVAVEANRVYQLGEVHQVVISSLPDSHLESVIYFSTGASAVEIDILQSHKLIGDLTTQANKQYVISIANRVIIMGEASQIDLA